MAMASLGCDPQIQHATARLLGEALDLKDGCRSFSTSPGKKQHTFFTEFDGDNAISFDTTAVPTDSSFPPMPSSAA